MTAILALIAAAGIILLIRAIVIMDRAEKVMSEVAAKAREVANLAAAIKAQNDAMRERNVLTGSGGNGPNIAGAARVSVNGGGYVTSSPVVHVAPNAPSPGYRGPNWYC